MARTLCINTQLTYHIIYHPVHPFTSEHLEAVQQITLIKPWTVLLTELTAHELEDDPLVHFRTIVVVVH